MPIAERNGFGREDEEGEEKKEKGGAGSGAEESEIWGALLWPLVRSVGASWDLLCVSCGPLAASFGGVEVPEALLVDIVVVPVALILFVVVRVVVVVDVVAAVVVVAVVVVDGVVVDAVLSAYIASCGTNHVPLEACRQHASSGTEEVPLEAACLK